MKTEDILHIIANYELVRGAVEKGILPTELLKDYVNSCSRPEVQLLKKYEKVRTQTANNLAESFEARREAQG